jgi:hypothetical protein
VIRRATIRIDLYEPEHGEDGTIYTLRRMLPAEWLTDERYLGYAAFEFEELYREFVLTRKDQP